MSRRILLFSMLCYCSTLLISCERTLIAGPLNDRRIERIENDYKFFWSEIIDSFDQYYVGFGVEELWNRIKPQVSPIIQPKCLETVDSIVKKWYDKQTSAKMFTSTGFMPVSTGVLSSTTIELGDYDSCIDIHDNHGHWDGQYCIATLNIPRSRLFQPTNITKMLSAEPGWKTELLQKWYNFDNHYSLARGFCSPSHCQSDDLKQILQAAFPTLNNFDLNVGYCQTIDHKPHDRRVWIPVTIVLVSIIFVILGTVYSKNVQKRNGKLDSIIRSFDVITNFQKLFNVDVAKTVSNKTRFDCFDGIRVVFTLIVIIVHVGMTGQVTQMKIFPTAHYPDVVHKRMENIVTLIAGQPHSVISIYMLISSILMSYTGLQKDKLKESFPRYIIKRWARYVPTLIGCMCIFMMTELSGDGPLFHHDNIDHQIGQCYDYWWRNVFLIQNMFELQNACIQPTWFMATEFQLRIVSFVLLLVYSKLSSRKTMLASAVFISAGILARIIILLQFDTHPTLLVHIFPEYPYYANYFAYVHSLISQYIGAYAIGFTIGQILFEKRQFSFTITRHVIFGLLGIFSLAYNGFKTIDIIRTKQFVDMNPSFFENILGNLSIFFFNISAGYLIFYLLRNSSNSVTQFFSHKFFLPLSKLSYSVYLIHFPVLFFISHQTRSPISYDSINLIIQMICLVTAQSIVAAVFLHVVFEAPWDGVVRVLFNKPKARPVSDENRNTIEQKKDLILIEKQ